MDDRDRDRVSEDTRVGRASPEDRDLDPTLAHPLDRDLGSDEITVEAPLTPDPRVPDSIGEYRILGKLGEGGMGVVYEALQQNPRRRVALKVVRGGRLVDELQLKLFQREVETLARLKHQNIGAIYASGCTDDGQHYFAMELVRGETLDAWLRKRPAGLDREELELRLYLFRKIADAVHYAHQRGVIHRDLKPTNIIVTDATAVRSSLTSGVTAEIKILDFGLARMTDTDRGGATALTEIGAIRGTLGYMSPEQTQGNPADIDVRTDVYTLGILLYEMLTRGHPYDTGQTALVEAVRVICEVRPRSLSENWAGSRKPDGDLETIVGRALEKERDRRYVSAAALSEDVGRYLISQPILARPPSATYQLRKLVGRHKLAFAFAATLGVLLLGFGVGMSVLYARAMTAEAQASNEAQTAERALSFVTEMFETSDPSHARGNSITAREILDHGAQKIETELGDQPGVQARLMGTVGWVYRGLGLYEDAEPMLERSLDLKVAALGREHPRTLHAMNDLAFVYTNRGRLADADALHAEAYETRQLVLGVDHPDTLQSMNNLAVLRVARQRYDEATQLYTELIEIQDRVLGPDARETLSTINNLAVMYADIGRYDEAEELQRRALEGRRRVLGADHPDTLNSMNNLAVLYEKQGRVDEAEPIYRRSLDSQRRVLGADHPETLLSLYNLGSLYLRQGRYTEAEPLFLEALAGQRAVLGDRHVDTLDTLYNLACISALDGKPAQAIDFLAEAVESGYTFGGNPEGILSDPDLDSLHGEPGFKAIATKIKRRP